MIAATLMAWAAASAAMMVAAGGAGGKGDLAVLRAPSAGRQEVAAAAVRVAGSGNAAALHELGGLLASEAFLARLDDTANPQLATVNVRQVLKALAARPSAATEAASLQAAASPAFTADTVRLQYALMALAEVRPLSAEGAALFAKTNGEGFYAFNGPLLAANGGERAGALLEAMFADRSQQVDDRIAVAREAVPPNRTKPTTVRVVDRLASRDAVEPAVLVALAESLYEYRPDEWYGKRREPPLAAPWSAAPTEARRAAVTLGRRLLARHDLPAALRAAIEAFVAGGGGSAKGKGSKG